MIEDIRHLTKEDKIHKLILSNALVYTNIGQFSSPHTPGVLGGTRQSVRYSSWDDEQELTEDEIYDIFNRISDRIYYITKSPNFVFEDGLGVKQERVDTIRCGTTPEEVETILKHNKNKFIIFYRIYKISDVFHIRVFMKDDPMMLRDDKINQILGE